MGSDTSPRRSDDLPAVVDGGTVRDAEDHEQPCRYAGLDTWRSGAAAGRGADKSCLPPKSARPLIAACVYQAGLGKLARAFIASASEIG